MKKSYLFLLVGAMMFAGCGKDHSGLYKGNETASASGVAALNQSGSLNITSGKDSNMAGTYADQSGSASFTGQLASDGNSIQNVSITVPAGAASSTINGVPSTGCGGTYTGTLTLTDTHIGGSLTITAASAAAQSAVSPYSTSPYGSQYNGASTPTTATTSICTGATRSFDLTKQ